MQKEKRKGLISSISLFLQSGYISLLSFVSFFLISLKSSAYILGLYNAVLASLSIFNYITNLGLAAALVHKKEIDEEDINSVFYFQVAITSFAILLGFLFTDKIIGNLAEQSPQVKYIYWSVLISFLFFALKTPPSVLLEKKIEIYKNVVVQAVENSLFYLSVILLTYLGKPLTGIIIGILGRAIIGIITIYIINPWKPKILFSINKLKKLLSYGLLLQGNSILALIKDDLVILYLTHTIGLNNLGKLMFAKKFAEIFLRIINDNLNRVFFPIYAKYQTEKEKLSYFISTHLKYNTLLSFPLILGTAFIFSDFLKLFPGYFEKWHSTLPMFYLFSLSSLLVLFISGFTNLFNAVGKVKWSLSFMILWTANMWLGVVIITQFFDYTLLPLIFIINGLTAPLIIRKAKEIADFNLFKSIKTTIVASTAMLISLFLTKFLLHFTNLNIQYTVALTVIIGAISYLSTVLAIESIDIIRKVLLLLKSR